MYLSYQILRNLAPEPLTVAQQRAADDQLGRIAAALSRFGRSQRDRPGNGESCGDLSKRGIDDLSKVRPTTASCRVPSHAA